MKTRFIYLMMVALCCSATTAFAQSASDEIKPKWLHKLPKPTSPTFIYQVVPSSAYSLEDARSMALQSLISDAGMESGVVIVSDYKSTEKVSQKWENGKLTEMIKNDIVSHNIAQGHEVLLHASYIDEYWEQDNTGLFHVQRLYARSELGREPKFDDVELTTSYASDPLTLVLALFPGAAQFHKGSKLKGGLILGGTALLAVGIILTENERANYRVKFDNTHDVNIQRAYATKRDHLKTGRDLCIGAVATVWLYNVLDAIFAPGARRTVVKQRANGNNYAFTPTVLDGNAPGMAVAMTF